MCQDSRAFTTSFHKLEEPIEVVLGDGRALMAVGRGNVVLDCLLPNGESTLHDVLYVFLYSTYTGPYPLQTNQSG